MTIIENFDKHLRQIPGCEDELKKLVRTKANDTSTRRLSIDEGMEKEIKLILGESGIKLITNEVNLEANLATADTLFSLKETLYLIGGLESSQL